MPISPEQRAAYAALPTVEVNLEDLSLPERFALMQLQGNLPFASPEQVVEMRQATDGLSRAQQLALLMDGVQQLSVRGVVVRDGVDAEGQPQFVLYPKVKLNTPMQTLRQRVETLAAATEK